jgi:hypothetical protein
MARLVDLTVGASLRPDFNVSSTGCAPWVLTGLARLVHSRQGATGTEDKRHSERDHERCLHGETRFSLPPEPAIPGVNWRVDERPMNAIASGSGISFAPGCHGRWCSKRSVPK